MAKCSREDVCSKIHKTIRNLKSQDPEAAYQWYLDLNAFIADYLRHMTDEENSTARLASELLTIEEFQSMEGKIMAEVQPEALMRAFRVMVPAMRHDERAHFLKGIKANVPPPAFEGMMANVSVVLDQVSLGRLKKSL